MINEVILVGRIGKDPEVKSIGENTLTKFSLATSESYKDKSGEWKEKTQWHQVSIWREAKLQKGDLVFLKGKIEYREHEGKWYTEIIADKVRRIGGNTAPTANNQPETDFKNEGLPF